MPLEPDFDNIDDLDPANPFPDDPVSEGDDQLRGIKSALQGNVTGDDVETRLLVAGIVAALVDATALNVIARAKIDLDNSAADEQTAIQLRNLIGGWAFGLNAGTGRMQLDQLDAAGAFELIALTMERAGKAGLRFNGVEQLVTQDNTLEASANSGASVKDRVGVLKPVGFNSMPTDPGGNPNSFTLNADFNGRRIRPNATITITVVGTSLPADGVVVISNQGAGTVTLLGSGGPQFTLFLDGSTTIVGSFTMIQGQVITLTRLQATNTYEVWGTFQAP